MGNQEKRRTRTKRNAILLALALTLLIVSVCTPFVSAASLTEEEAAKRGGDVYEAWSRLNNPYYSYVLNDFVSPYRTYVDDLGKRADWNATLVAWRIATFDVKSEESYAMKEVGYYDAVVFNILYDADSSSVGTSFVSTLADGAGDIEKNIKQISTSTFKTLCDLDSDHLFTSAGHMDFSDPEVKAAFLNHVVAVSEVKKSMEKLGDFGKYVGYCTTVLDAVEKISKVEALLRVSDETAEVIKDMRDNCSNLILKATLSDYYDIVSNSLSEEIIAAIFATNTAAKYALGELTGGIWKAMISAAGEAGFILSAGQTIGKFTADFLTNSSGIIGEYYHCQAMATFEDLVKSEMRKCQSAFESNPTAANAKKFLAAYDILCKTIFEGLDCSASFVKAAKAEGTINKIRIFFGDTEYDDLSKTISRIKQSVKEGLNYEETISFNNYVSSVSLATPVASPLPEVSPVTDEQFESLERDTRKVRDLVFSKDTTLTEDVETYGNVLINYGTLNLNGHTLSVGGDVLHTNGKIIFNKGTLIIGGDYRIQNTTTNSAGDVSYTYSSGRLDMEYDEDTLQVGGLFVVDSSYESTLKSGTVKLSGGFQQLRSSSASYYSSFNATGSHTVILEGTKPQTVQFASNGSSGFQNLQIEKGADVTFAGYVRAYAITADGEAKTNNAIFQGFNMSGHKLKLTGNAGINGDMNMAGGTLEITGDVLHTNGKIVFTKGALIIGGDYRIQNTTTNSAGDVSYTYSSGRLDMEYDEDTLQVGGLFVVDSNYESTLKAGTVKLSGGFQQLRSSSASYYSSFSATGSHTVILEGSDIQHVSFSSYPSSGLQNLQLTQDISRYVFDPNPCWKNLVGFVPIVDISLDKTEMVLTEGSEETLVLTISPSDATDKAVTWLSSDTDIATVSDGKVTALSAGTAVITASASGKSKSCTVKVISDAVEIQSVSYQKGTATVTIVNPLNNGSVICVGYDSSGKMLIVEIKPMIANQVEYNFIISDTNIVKAFIVDANMRPLCASKSN